MPSPAPPRIAPPAAVWTAAGLRIADPRFAADAGIDLEHPRHGIRVAHSAVVAGDAVLGLDLRSDARLADHWLRGADVTAVYESTDARRLRTTAMWRLRPSAAGTIAWELIVSAQTALVQSDSSLAVVSEVDATECLWGSSHDGGVRWRPDAAADATCVLLRRGGSAASSVLVAAHPGETRRIAVRRQGPRAVVECWLFSAAIEKGVLLRSRVLAAIGPTATDLDWAAEIAATFSTAPPMLTT